MCGSSGGSTAPPPSPPPTTFSYTAADNSNARRQVARSATSTDAAPGTVLGNGMGTGASAGSTPEGPGTGGYR